METMYGRIRRKRVEKGMTQRELARLAGYADESGICNVESGRRDIRASKIPLFAAALGTSPEWLLTGRGKAEFAVVTVETYAPARRIPAVLCADRREARECVEALWEARMEELRNEWPAYRGGVSEKETWCEGTAAEIRFRDGKGIVYKALRVTDYVPPATGAGASGEDA